MKETINQRITRYRKNAKLSQVQVAEILKIKGSTYSQMERKGKINSDIIIKLEEILGLEEGVLLYGEKEDKIDFSPIKENLVTFNQPKFSFEIEESMVLSKNEENYIRILRSLPKNDFDDVIELLQEKYKKNK